MTGFFWASGHLGWGLFALLVFSVMVWLGGDLCWRLTRVGARTLGRRLATAWMGGAALIVLASWLAGAW